MIKHIVIWQLGDDDNSQNKLINAQKIKEKLEALNGVIPGLVALEVGIDISKSPASGDVVLYSVFESQQALENYQQHPAHVAAAQFIISAVHKRQVVDYEI